MTVDNETTDEQIPDSLKPLALTPLAWQFPIACAVTGLSASS